MAAGASYNTSLTTTGVAAGWKVTSHSFTTSTNGLVALFGNPTTDAVPLTLFNPTAGAVDLGSMTLSINLEESPAA